MVTKQQWVKVLESNQYTPGQGQLRSLDNKFCPLGVLTDLLIKEGKLGLSWDKTEDGYVVQGNGVELPPEARVATGINVAQWHVIRTHDGRVAETGAYNNLLENPANHKPKKPFQDVLEFIAEDAKNEDNKKGRVMNIPNFVV